MLATFFGLVLIFSAALPCFAEDLASIEDDLRNARIFTNLNSTLIPINATVLAATLGIAALIGIGVFFLYFALISSKGTAGGNLFGGYNNNNQYGGYSYDNQYHSQDYSRFGYNRRSNENSIDWESLNILDYISMMEEIWKKLDAKNIDCQKRILCEVHQNELQFGPGASKVIGAFGYVKYLSLLRMPPALQALLEEYSEAADQGRSIKDCGELYDSCEFSFKDIFMKHFGKKHENNLE